MIRHNREFLKLWGGQTISEIGSRITREGLPLTAAFVLDATPADMGILAATGGASVLLFSLAAGIMADRVKRRPLMIATDLGRAAVLLSIPLLALAHQLRMVHLIAVAACAGVLTVLFDVAYQSYLPSVVSADELFEGNRLLAISSSTAEIVGPQLTGVLVQAISGPMAILLDAASFVVSALSLSAIRGKEPRPRVSSGEPLRTEMLEGMRTILAHPILRTLLFRAILTFLSVGPLISFYVLYSVRVLHLTPTTLGFAIAVGGAGSLLGGLTAGKLAKRFPLKPTFFASALVIAGTQCLLPLAGSHPRFALFFVCAQQFVGDCAWTVYFVNETVLRQSAVPRHVLGRVNATMQFASRGMVPIGALISGFVAAWIGMTNTLWIGAAGNLLSVLWLLPLVL